MCYENCESPVVNMSNLLRTIQDEVMLHEIEFMEVTSKSFPTLI